MLHLDRSQSPAQRARFALSLATTHDDIEEALRLRWSVFVEEQGARPQPGRPGVETDRFDPFCRHLIVRDLTNDLTVGTYRVLTWDGASKLGGFYTEQEFDLQALAKHRPHIVEVGRSCVHRDYRSGVVISLLWAGLAGIILDTDARYMIGCASIAMQDGGREAAGIYRKLAEAHLTSEEMRMAPLKPLPLDSFNCVEAIRPPPLIKGYLRAGVKVAGPPAVDPDFGTADLPMLLKVDRMSPRYARHFVGA